MKRGGEVLRGLLNNNRGAVLLVVLFVIILIIGLAYAFTIVAISTYKTAQNEINAQQAIFEAQSTANLIMNQLISDPMQTEAFISQLNQHEELTGTYTGDNGERGQFRIYYPTSNRSKIHIEVSSTVGQLSRSVTNVIHGESNVDEHINSFNIYITDPSMPITGRDKTVTSYAFDNMRAAGAFNLFIMPSDGYRTFIMSGNFPHSGNDNNVVVSGDLTMQGESSTKKAIYNSKITSYGNLTLSSNVIVKEDIYVTSSFVMQGSTNELHKSIISFGNATIGGGSVGILANGNITAAAEVRVFDAEVGVGGGSIFSIRSKSNVIVNNSNLRGGINGQGNSITVTGGSVGTSLGGAHIYARNNLTLNSTIVNGDVHVKGDLIMDNTTINGNVWVDGNVIMRNGSKIGKESDIGVYRSLNTKGNLAIEGASKNIITGDCIINGKLTMQWLSGSNYHQFGTISTHRLSIGTYSDNNWEGKNVVKLYSAEVAGTLISPYMVVFNDSPTAEARKSKIEKLYIQDNNSKYSHGEFGYIDMGNSEIGELIVMNHNSVAKEARISNATIMNLYGAHLYLKNVIQPAGGKFDGTKIVFESSATDISGRVFSTTSIDILGNMNIQETARLYAPNGIDVNNSTGSTREGQINAGVTVNINGPLGDLYLAPNTNAILLGANASIGGDLVSNSNSSITIEAGVITGNLYTNGPVIVNGGTIGKNIKTPLTVTINAGSNIGGTDLTHQIYAGSGVIDNGGSVVQSIYNDATSILTINSTVNGYIYTRGNININEGSAVGGYVRALGTGTSIIKRSINGNLQVGGALDMWDTAVTGLSVGGNVRAANARFYSTIINGNLHTTGSGVAAWGGRTIWLEGGPDCKVQGSLYAQHASGNVRLGRGCTIGTAYVGGQLNFSAGNYAYGNVYCGSFVSKSSSDTCVEGTNNHIYGNLFAVTGVEIKHSASAGGLGASSYQGIYSNGKVEISDVISSNGSIAYVRGAGSIEITNYSISGEVFGPANVTLTNAPAGKVHPRDGSSDPTNWVRLVGNSPVAGDVYSGNGFIQSENSPIGGSLRVNNSSGETINIKANVNGEVFLPNGANAEVNSSVIIGNNLFATNNIEIKNQVTIGGYVSSYQGNIVIGDNCNIVGNVITRQESGGSITIGEDSPIVGGITARGIIKTGNGSTVSGNVYSEIGSVFIGANVNGSVRAKTVFNSVGNATITGDLLAEGTETHTIDGSVYGDVWVNGPLNIIAASGGSAGVRQIGANTSNKLRCNGALEVAVQYDIKGHVNNITGNMTIMHNVGGSVECPNGNLWIEGNVGGSLRSWNTTLVGTSLSGGNIGGDLFVYGNSNPEATGGTRVTVYGNIEGSAIIKGHFYQYGSVSGALKTDGGYYPQAEFTEFPALNISGDFSLPANATKLGAINANTNITGTLTINVNAYPHQVHIYGEIRCGSLRVNYNGEVTTIFTDHNLSSNGFGGGNRNNVIFYDNVHVKENAYVIGATFNKYISDDNPGSSLFVGKHLAARDCSFYSRGYKSSNEIAIDRAYGSISVGYNITGTSGASAGDYGSAIMRGCSIYSRTQVKGNAYYYHSDLSGSSSELIEQKISHYIGGNLTLHGSRIHGNESNPNADTLVIVNGNCELIHHNPGWHNPTYIGNTQAVYRRGNNNYRASFEGLYVNGTLTVGNDTAIYVDVYANMINNSGIIQIGDIWKWGT